MLPKNAPSNRNKMKSFTLLEFLVASFLATLLLLLIYQAFGQTTLFFRRERHLTPQILEEYFWQKEILSLKKPPVIRNGYLFFCVEDLPGPYCLIYDFEKGRYAEHKSLNLPKDLENLNWFKEKGIKSLNVYIFKNNDWVEWPLDKGSPPTPYLLKVFLSSGIKIENIFR